MNNSPAPATRNSAMSAALNSLCLLSPQRFNKPVPVRGRLDQQLVDPTVKHIFQSVEITVGTDPQVLIRRAVNTVGKGALRNFLRSVMSARDVNRVLTLLQDDGPKFQRLPIDRLRAAAQAASHQSLQGPRARDTLYAAVVISGIESLLGETVEPPYSSTDVIRSVVRDAMRTLDAVDTEQADDLRSCLGWGNADEAYNPRAEHLQYQVTHAVQNMRNYRTPTGPRSHSHGHRA